MVLDDPAEGLTPASRPKAESVNPHRLRATTPWPAPLAGENTVRFRVTGVPDRQPDLQQPPLRCAHGARFMESHLATPGDRPYRRTVSDFATSGRSIEVA